MLRVPTIMTDWDSRLNTQNKFYLYDGATVLEIEQPAISTKKGNCTSRITKINKTRTSIRIRGRLTET